MCYGSNVPLKVLEYVISLNTKHLSRVFKSAKEGIHIRANGNAVHINLCNDTYPKCCPCPKGGYGVKRDILTRWAEKQIACDIFEHAQAAPWKSHSNTAHKGKHDMSEDADVFNVRIVRDYEYSNS